MKTINRKYVESLNPCESRWRNALKYYKDFNGTVLQFLRLRNINVSDKFWVVLQDRILPNNILNEFACRCAEHVLPIFEKKFPFEKRIRKAIEAKRMRRKGIEIDRFTFVSITDPVWGARQACVWAIAGQPYSAVMEAREVAKRVRAEEKWQLKELIKLVKNKK